MRAEMLGRTVCFLFSCPFSVSFMVGFMVRLWSFPHTHDLNAIPQCRPMSWQVVEVLRGVAFLAREVQGRGFGGLSPALSFLVPVVLGIANTQVWCSELCPAFSVMMDWTTVVPYMFPSGTLVKGQGKVTKVFMAGLFVLKSVSLVIWRNNILTVKQNQ